MKPLKNKIIVAVDLRQKSDYEIETDGGLKLWTNSDFGHDGNVKNPVVATVVSPGRHTDVQAGDNILCHYHTFNMMQDPSGQDESSLLGFTGVKDDRGWIFAIERSLVLFKVSKDGNPEPLDGFIAAERIKNEYDSDIIIPDSAIKTIENQFRAVKVGPGCDGIKDGDILVTYKKADVSVNYTFKKKQKSFVRIKAGDVLAVSKEVHYG